MFRDFRFFGWKVPVKTVYLLRHAKSSWDDPELADFERPLNARGRNAARFIGRLMHERGIVPGSIICSPAKRARQTAELVGETGGLQTPTFDERIYAASPLILLDLLRETAARTESVMIVGHNPGLGDLVRILTGRSETLPTAALVRIDLGPEDWPEIDPGSGELAFIVRPKDLMGR